ncbi:MAG: hypothetical protein ABI793_11870 [Flavobacterium sp.]
MKKYNFPIGAIFLSILIFISCKETKSNMVQSSDKTSALKAGYQIEPVNIQNVKLSDSFTRAIASEQAKQICVKKYLNT